MAGNDELAALLAQTRGLSTVDDRDKLLQGQLARALAFSQPRNQQHTSAMGAGLSALADALRQGVGGYQVGQAEKQQADLMKERETGRNAFAEALSNYGREQAPQIPEMLQRPGYDAQAVFDQEHARRGEALAQMGMGSGDAAIMPMAQELSRAPAKRLERAQGEQGLKLGAVKLLDAQRQLEDENAPASPIYHQVAARLSLTLPDGLNNKQAREALGLGKDIYAAEMRGKEVQANRAAMAGARSDAREERVDVRRAAEEAKAKAAADKKAQSVLEIEDRYQNIKDRVEGLRTLINENGTYELVGPHNELMTQKLNDIAVDTAKLVDPGSVARESDINLAKKSLPGVGVRQSNATALKLLQEFETDMGKRRANAYKVRGLDLPGGNAGGGVVAAPKRIRDASGRTGTWDGVSPLPPGVEVIP